MGDMEFITDYSVHRHYAMPADPSEQYMIIKYPVYEVAQGRDGAVLGYRQMTDEEIDNEILLCNVGDGTFITLADFKKRFILSLT